MCLPSSNCCCYFSFVRQVDLDLKALVVEAYHLGMHELLYIVPFVAKVLESCAKSKVSGTPAQPGWSGWYKNVQ